MGVHSQKCYGMDEVGDYKLPQFLLITRDGDLYCLNIINLIRTIKKS